MQLYGDLYIASFIRINKLRWIGHVNGMVSKIMAYQVFVNQLQGNRQRGRPRSRWRECVYGDVTKYRLGTEVEN
jgi:hypothetical protein